MGIGFDFPKDQGNVNGSGVFYAWGTYSNPILGIQGIAATWIQGGTQVNGQVSWWFPGAGVWAAEVLVGNLAVGTAITLTVTGMSQQNPMQPPVQVPEAITFTFRGASPQVGRPHHHDHEEEY
jgi:hypothetical protein